MSMPTVKVPEGLETGHFILGAGALEYLGDFLAMAFPGLKPWIVADENTFRAAGEKVCAVLQQSQIEYFEPYIFPGSPVLHPDYAHSEMLAEIMPGNCVPLAVGSGVINDLVKCAAGLRDVKYCCIPTACSVDGYTSSGAALAKYGTKQTVKCPAPWAICADVDILKTAPPEMMASGYADLLTKIPAGADWIIADELNEDPIRPDVWDFIQGQIREKVADCHALGPIFDGLAATGYAMQMMSDSRPASGAEHLFSHVWEMEGLTCNGNDVSHGFKVGVGLLASTLLHEFILENDIAKLNASPILTTEAREKEIDELLIKGCYGDAPKKTALQKFRTGEDGLKQRQKIAEAWPVLQQRLAGQVLSYTQLLEMLKKANCPVTPSEIGLDAEQFIHGIKTAQLIRNRYTVLDLLYEAGLLDLAIAEKLQNFAQL